MAGTVIQIPSFNFAAFFYPEILESLLIYKRANIPELTDESDQEPSIQLLRAFALVGHLNNVLADAIANESTLPTAKLPETVRNMLRLIDFEVRPATPAGAEQLVKLSRIFSVPREVVPDRAQFATRRREGDNSEAYFEALVGLTTERTDQYGAVYAEESGVFTDHTTDANAGTTFQAFASVDSGDKLYFGHATAMWSQMNLDVVTTPLHIAIGVWEYYDGDALDTEPDSVTNVGGGVLRFNLNVLLGDQNRFGAEVTIQLDETGASQTVTSQWDGSNNYAETNLLGQSVPSTTTTDYTVGVLWQEFLGIVDGTANLQATGDVDYTFPQTEEENWKPTTINDFEGYFTRFRVVETSGAGAYELARCRMDTGDTYVLVDVVQGRSVQGEILGSSNGDGGQEFETSREYFIDGSQEVRVNAEVWTEVDNFLSSSSQDKHYRIQLGENDKASVVFGDGVTGRVPDVGQGNIAIDYRFGADVDGNVGARTIVVDKTGLSFVNSVTNPRQATGWAEADTASEESLERVKIEGPATLRTKETAISPNDVEDLTSRFTDANGSSPFSRSSAIEEGFGPKTVEHVVVANGGGQATGAQLAALDLYFNGDGTSANPKRMVSNQQVVSVNHTPRPINVTATVYASVDLAAEIRNALAGLLQPEALEDDGVTYVWDFGGEIPDSRINHEIFNVDSRISKVILTEPSSPIQLDRRELPANGTFNITIILEG